MNADSGGSVWFIAVVIGAAILGCVLAYVTIANRRATKDPHLTKLQEEGTRRARREDQKHSVD